MATARLHRHQIKAIVEGDQSEDTGWGQDLARKLDAKADVADLRLVVEAMMTLQNAFGSPSNLTQAFTDLSQKLDALDARVTALEGA